MNTASPDRVIPLGYGLAGFAILILVEMVLAFGGGFILGRGEGSVYLVTLIARMTDVLVIALLLRRRGLGWQAVGLDRLTWRRGLAHAVAWGLAAGAAVLAVTAPRWAASAPVSLFFSLSGGRETWFFLVGTVAGPAVEELVFRGWFYGALRARLPVLAALPLSALVFGFFHGPEAGPTLTALAGGLIFAASYETSRSLLTPILLHVAGNGALRLAGALGLF